MRGEGHELPNVGKNTFGKNLEVRSSFTTDSREVKNTLPAYLKEKTRIYEERTWGIFFRGKGGIYELEHGGNERCPRMGGLCR